MRLVRAVSVTAAFMIGVGCWSMGSTTPASADRATPTPYTAEATPTPKATTSPKGTPAMNETKTSGEFSKNLAADFEQPQTDAAKLLFREYGSLFVARNGATPPKKVVFSDEADVAAFQASVRSSTERIGAHNIELQSAAMTALKAAIADARAEGANITPSGADSGKRGYKQTVTLWASRVNPGLVYWVGKGRITQADANRIKALTPFEQVPEILALEKQGIYFAKDLSKSIIYSVAPPGTSQHLSMLALDVTENENSRVRAILARHGWFQTVASDLPHFTYLGVTEAELPGLGLKSMTNSGRTFWVPDI